MQYQIIKLVMAMIEQEWNSLTSAQKPWNRYQPYTVQEYADYLQGQYKGVNDYVAKLACAYYWLNKLKAHY